MKADNQIKTIKGNNGKIRITIEYVLFFKVIKTN